VIESVALVGGLVAGAVAMARPRGLPDVVSGTAGAGAVSVVIPARNAASTIAPLLASLGSFGSGVAEVIVVDDASTDATADVATAHGATVVRLDGDPPPGWTGKCYACDRGAAVATGSLLLFLDADVTIRDGAVDRLVAAHAEQGGLVSVQPYHRVRRPYETLSATCNVVAMMGAGSFAPWHRMRRPTALGPCILASAADYVSAGGHAAVRGEVVEDVHLARRFHARGLPVSVFAGSDAIEFRMYPDGLRQLVEGWTKNIAAGARLVHPASTMIAVWWVSACIGLTLMSARLALGAHDVRGVVGALGCWLAVTVELRWMWRRIGSFGWLAALLHPILTAAFMIIFVRSAWLTAVRRRVRWSGRQIALAGRRAG